MFKKLFVRLQKDKCEDAAELLRLTIESMEQNKHSAWSIAHDDDLRTLKRAYHILQRYSK
jgi:hypothetical protein